MNVSTMRQQHIRALLSLKENVKILTKLSSVKMRKILITSCCCTIAQSREIGRLFVYYTKPALEVSKGLK